MQDICKKISYLVLISLGISCTSQKREPTRIQQAIIDKAKENFVFVEGGTFIMGNNDVYKATEHQVTLDSYSISKYETTFKEFDVYSELNGLEKVAPNYRDSEELGPEYGVQFENWHQAEAYCNWLGKQLNLSLGLPTEAQWEYAARSRGKDVEHATDSGKIEGNFTEKRNYKGSKVKVGSYPPNPLGIYDMSGGRPEWTNDWFVSYEEGPLVNPRYDSIVFSKKKMVRGWHNLSYSVYSRRGVRKPDNYGSGVGFRCACNQKTPIN